MTRNKLLTQLALLFVTLLMTATSFAEQPVTREDGVTVIHLDQYGGYFAAKETVAGLKAGEYEFVITNKTSKLVGFHIQNFKSRETLDKFPIKPGQPRVSKVTITEEGVRFRCPINPTPWYDLDLIKG